MRIPKDAYGTNTNLRTDAARAPADGSKKVGGRLEADSSAKDSVKVTVSAEAAALARDGGTSAAKVDRLRGVVERGELKVDPHAIAARIVEGG